jgi:tetratricopeptide (TPR) repeat protein
MLKHELNTLIAKAKLKEAIELLQKENIEDSDLSAGLDAICNSYAEFDLQFIKGSLSSADEDVKKTKITQRLQALIAQLPEDKPTPTHPRNTPTDYDTTPLDIGFLSKRPHNVMPDMASLGKYMPDMARRMKDLGHYSKLDDMVTMSAGVNRVMSDIFDPFIKTVRDSTHLSHLHDEVGFNEIAFTDELPTNARLFIANLREHPTAESRYKRNLIISALTLSLVRQFDTSKFYILSDFIADAEPHVWKRALVGLYFALSGREDALDPFLQDKLKRLCANEDVQKGLEDIEIIIKNQEYLLSDKDNNAFTDINNDPFFKSSPHNWFMEFRPDHPSVKTALKNSEVLDLLQNAPDLPINAFRYAFALNYNQYDATQKKQMIDKAKAQKITLEKRYPSVQEREKQRENNAYRQFARELYFFYKMYNQDEYQALLEKNISLYHSPLRDILFSEKCQNRISARLDFLEKKFDVASEKLLKINDDYNDYLIPALIGWCYFGMNNYEQALYYLQISYNIEPLNTSVLNKIGDVYRIGFNNNDEALIWHFKAYGIEDNSSWNLNHIGACYQFREQANYDEALKWYLKAFRIESEHAWNLNRIGDCYYRSKNSDYDQALVWYLKAYKIDNRDADNLNQIGACYQFKENNDYEESLVWYLKAYDIQKDNAWNLNRIGACHYANKNYHEALNWFLKAYEITNNDVWTLNYIGNCHYLTENQDYSEALKWYFKAYEIENEDVANLNQIGDCYYLNEKSNYNEALVWFLKAYEIEKNNAWNLNRIGGCYYFKENKDYNEALIWFSKAHEIEKGDAWNLNRIGSCHYFKDNKSYNEALKWYLKAYEIENDDSWNLNSIGNCYYFKENRDYNEALIWFLKAYKIDNNNVTNLNRIGECYFNDNKNYEEALIWHLKAHEIEKNNTDNLNRIAYCYVNGIKNYSKALYYYLISEIIETSTELIKNIAFAYFKLNQQDKYNEYLNKCLLVEPKDARYYGELGWLGLITSNIPFAKEYLEKAIELGELSNSQMNLGHIHLIESNKTEALELYKRSITEMKDDKRFFNGMTEDYEYLSPHGITEADYAEVIATLRQFCAENASA